MYRFCRCHVRICLRRAGFQLAHEQRRVANSGKAASSTGAAFFVRVRSERAVGSWLWAFHMNDFSKLKSQLAQIQVTSFMSLKKT